MFTFLQDEFITLALFYNLNFLINIHFTALKSKINNISFIFQFYIIVYTGGNKQCLNQENHLKDSIVAFKISRFKNYFAIGISRCDVI